MSDYKLLIFDWDGTLVDSIGRIVTAIRQSAELYGLPQREEAAIKGIIGLAIQEAILTLYPDLAGSNDVQAFQQSYADHYLALEAEPSSAYPGVPEVLQGLQEEGYLLAVATGKTRRGLDRVLQAHDWSSRFGITRCADETASKPDPRMLQEILDHHGLSAKEALMIGDSVFDLQMARNAGMDALGVSYGAQEVSVLAKLEPQHIIAQFEQLPAWLAAQKQRGLA